MGKAIRVLLAEDSATSRVLLRSLIEMQSDMVVAGEAVNGQEAVQLVAKLKPDVVVMDVHMPRLNGVEATKAIMQDTPCPIIIASGRVNTQEHPLAFAAMQAGALKVMAKPAEAKRETITQVAQEFTDVLRTFAGVKVIRHYSSSRNVSVSKPPRADKVPSSPREALPVRGATLPAISSETAIVAIGTSTGGPPALAAIFEKLPAEFSLPVLVTQHITKGFTDGFATWLDGCTALTVRVAKEGDALRPATVLVAPDERHLEVTSALRVRLTEEPPYRGQRPSVNRMFQSLARYAGSRTLAVVMTGMGDDGAQGAAAVETAGGKVLVQQPSTAVVSSMPHEAHNACTDAQALTLEEIAAALLTASHRR